MFGFAKRCINRRLTIFPIPATHAADFQLMSLIESVQSSLPRVLWWVEKKILNAINTSKGGKAGRNDGSHFLFPNPRPSFKPIITSEHKPRISQEWAGKRISGTPPSAHEHEINLRPNQEYLQGLRRENFPPQASQPFASFINNNQHLQDNIYSISRENWRGARGGGWGARVRINQFQLKDSIFNSFTTQAKDRQTGNKWEQFHKEKDKNKTQLLLFQIKNWVTKASHPSSDVGSIRNTIIFWIDWFNIWIREYFRIRDHPWSRKRVRRIKLARRFKSYFITAFKC